MMLFTSRQGSGLTRSKSYNLFSKAARLAGIEDGRVNPHVLKHSYASHLIRNGADLAYVQEGLRDTGTSLRPFAILTSRLRKSQVVSNRILGAVFAS